MRVIHVLRKPLSEGTVASNTLKHGTGGLNIDASRIAGLNPSVAQRERAAQTGHMGGAKGQKAQSTEAVGELRDRSSLEAYTTPRPGESLGRWPGNLILQHLDDCRREGTRPAEGYQINRFTDGAKHFGGAAGHPYETSEMGCGVEAVWACASGCPVRALDEQSGACPSTGNHPSTAKNTSIYRPGQPPMAQGRLYADTGGASRFFKQVGGEDA
jgi:hypothetical protein